MLVFRMYQGNWPEVFDGICNFCNMLSSLLSSKRCASSQILYSKYLHRFPTRLSNSPLDKRKFLLSSLPLCSVGNWALKSK